ncbi:hypothetical protein GEMRC1_011094 [Eukaryota sp. GEM-RC1]
MSLKPKDTAKFYFRKVTPTPNNCPEHKEAWQCRLCPNMIPPVYSAKNWIHVHKCHPNFNEEMIAAKNNATISRFLTPVLPDKPHNIFRWLEWCIENQMAFTFVQDPMIQKNCNLDPIDVKTLVKYMRLLYTEVCAKVAQLLPEEFGLMFDGWKHPTGTTEFVGMFACFPQKSRPVLLSLFPFELDEVYDESSPFKSSNVVFGAEQYKERIAIVLSAYDKTVDDLLFLVGDSCATNTRLADILCIPLIGCASHRFANEVKKFSGDLDPILKDIDDLFTQLRHIKNTLVLKTNTSLRPLRRNSTRWWSTIAMLKRFFQYIDRKSFDLFDESVTQFVPSFSEQQRLKTLMKQYETFHVLTLYLQRESIPLHQIHASLELFHQRFPTMNQYTSYPSSKQHSPVFESAIIKILNGHEDRLSTAEQTSVASFLKEDVEETDIEEEDGDNDENEESDVTNFEGALDSNGQPDKPTSKYIDLKWIPGTSNVLERLFSRAKHTLGDYRCSLSDSSLEQQLYLLYNRDLWNEDDVRKIISKRP